MRTNANPALSQGFAMSSESGIEDSWERRTLGSARLSRQLSAPPADKAHKGLDVYINNGFPDLGLQETKYAVEATDLRIGQKWNKDWGLEEWYKIDQCDWGSDSSSYLRSLNSSANQIKDGKYDDGTEADRSLVPGVEP